MPAAHANWSSLGAGGIYGGYSAAVGAGGTASARDPLDAARMGVGRIPSAEYPDGYLSTIRNRREDRVLDSLKNRQNKRAYQRGVHKGERIDPSDYFYPKGLDPQRGLRAQSLGKRQAPLAEMVPQPHLVNDGKAAVPNSIPNQPDVRRGAQLARLRPAWR